MPIIAVDVQHLTRHYPSRGQNALPVIANDDLSFHVLRGECFGLLGPNGAGKTTLISQLLGILAPTSGQIWVGGVDMVRAPQHGKQLIGYLPQHGLAMRSVEVERALHHTGRLRGQSEADARVQVREILDELELAPYAGRSVNKLAGGLARLAYFAMALMGHPPILILDEPTNELDPQKRKLIWDVLARRHREEGTTCILVTHNVLEAEKVLQRVGVMQHGRMIAIGTPGELKQRIGGMVRLEFWLKDGVSCTDAELGQITALGMLEQPRPGHYRIFLAPTQIVAGTELVMNQIGLARLDDFRLTPPSLEDVYLELDRAHSS